MKVNEVIPEDNRVISEKISLINKFCGLSLKPCDYFTGIRTSGGRKYFNAILNERCDAFSIELRKLERLERKGIISHVEPNGIYRVAIYL